MQVFAKQKLLRQLISNIVQKMFKKEQRLNFETGLTLIE